MAMRRGPQPYCLQGLGFGGSSSAGDWRKPQAPAFVRGAKGTSRCRPSGYLLSLLPLSPRSAPLPSLSLPSSILRRCSLVYLCRNTGKPLSPGLGAIAQKPVLDAAPRVAAASAEALGRRKARGAAEGRGEAGGTGEGPAAEAGAEAQAAGGRGEGGAERGTGRGTQLRLSPWRTGRRTCAEGPAMRHGAEQRSFRWSGMAGE